MKKYETAIVIVAVVIIGYLVWKNSTSNQVQNPTNATSPGYIPQYRQGDA